MDTFREHFELLYLLVILSILLAIYYSKPDLTKEWVAMVIGAILMRVRAGVTNGTTSK
jgi:hypothetical protein